MPGPAPKPVPIKTLRQGGYDAHCVNEKLRHREDCLAPQPTECSVVVTTYIYIFNFFPSLAGVWLSELSTSV